MSTPRATLFHAAGACNLLAAGAAMLFAGSAYAQPDEFEAYQGLPRPTEPAQPKGPVFSWSPLSFGVAGDLRATWPQNAAARRLAGKSIPVGGGVSLHYDALRPSNRLVAKVDLGWTMTSTSDTEPSTQNEETLKTNLVTLGLSVRYHIVRWLAPYARLAGGVGWDKLSVGSPTARMHDKQVFGHGSVGGGVYLRSPGLVLRPSWLGLGLSLALMGHIEGGYMIGSGSRFSLQSSAPPGVANPVPTESVPIGEVGRNAPYVRASLGVAF